MASDFSIYWMREFGSIVATPVDGNCDIHCTYLALSSPGRNVDKLVAMFLSPLSSGESNGAESGAPTCCQVLCGRVPEELRQQEILEATIYSWSEEARWKKQSFLLDGAASPGLMETGDAQYGIVAESRSDQPPSFKFVTDRDDLSKRGIGACAKSDGSTKRVSDFKLLEVKPADKIVAAIAIGKSVDGLYSLSMTVSPPSAVQEFNARAVLCHISRARFAMKMLPGSPSPEDDPVSFVHASALAGLLATEAESRSPVRTPSSVKAKLCSQSKVSTKIMALPGDVVVFETRGGNIDFKNGNADSDTDNSIKVGGDEGRRRLLFYCTVQRLELIGDRQAPEPAASFLRIAKNSLIDGSAEAALAAVSINLPRRTVAHTDLSPVWGDNIKTFLPDTTNLAPQAPHLLAVEQSWMACDPVVRAKLASEEVLALAASAGERRAFTEWLGASGGQSQNLAGVLSEGFSLDQQAGLDLSDSQTVADMIRTLADRPAALDVAIHLSGHLFLLPLVDDDTLADLAYILKAQTIAGTTQRDWTKFLASPELLKTIKLAMKRFGAAVGFGNAPAPSADEYSMLCEKLISLEKAAKECLDAEVGPERMPRNDWLRPIQAGKSNAFDFIDGLKSLLEELLASQSEPEGEQPNAPVS